MVNFYRMDIRRSNVWLYACISILLLVVMSGCFLTHSYVGKRFNTASWPKYSSGQKLVLNGTILNFEFVITETDVAGEYMVKGTMDGSKGSLKSIDHLVRRETNLFLILAKDGLVINCFPIMPQGLDHTHKLPFRRKMVTGPFDSVYISGQISVSG